MTKKDKYYSAIAMVLINVSLIINWWSISFKPFWYSEEASQRYNLKPVQILLNGRYSFDNQVSDGSVFNLLFVGFFTKFINVNNQFIDLYRNQIILSSILLWFTFIYLDIFIKNKALAIFGATVFSFSYVGLSSSIYYSKSCGILLFLIMSKILFSVADLKKVILFSSIFNFLFFGIISNFGVLSCTFLFLCLQFFLIKQGDLRKRYIKNLKIFLIVWLPIYFVSISYFYFLRGSFDNLSEISRLNGFLETNTDNFNYLVGGGHWSQIGAIAGYRYNKWWPDAGSLNYIVSMFLFLLCFYLFAMCLKSVNYVRENYINIDDKALLNPKIGKIGFLLLFYFTVAPFEINVIYYVTEYLPMPFAIFRDPWSKFYVYLFLLVILFFVYSIERSGVLRVAEDKKKTRSYFSRKRLRRFSLVSLIFVFLFSISNVAVWNSSRDEEELAFYSMNMKNTQLMQDEISKASNFIKNYPSDYVCIISSAEPIRQFVINEMRIFMGYDGNSYKNIDSRIKLCNYENVASTLDCSPLRNFSFVFFLPRSCYIKSPD